MRKTESILTYGFALLALLIALLPSRAHSRQRAGTSSPVATAPSVKLPVVPTTPLPVSLKVFGPPVPIPVFGPPPSPEMVADRELARQLLASQQAGRLALLIPEREGEQLKALGRDGVYCWPQPPPGAIIRSDQQQAVLEGTGLPDNLPARRAALPSRSLPPEMRKRMMVDNSDFDPLRKPPSPALLRMLTVLAAHSTPVRPLQLMSLLRPPYRLGSFIHVGPINPHSLGLAADICGYAGHPVDQKRPEECVAATLALLRDLPPGRYRLGMPKAPEAPLVTGRAPMSPAVAEWLPDLYAASSFGKPCSPSCEPSFPSGCLYAAAIGATLSEHPRVWPFFPAPQPLLEQGFVAPERLNGRPMTDSSGRLTPKIVRFRNEDYAELEDLHDPRLQHAIQAAQKQGVEIIGLFPDGIDHIHIDVRQNR